MSCAQGRGRSRVFDVGANDGTGTLRQRPVTLVSTSASVPGEHIPTPSYFAPSQRHAPITIVSPPEDVDGDGVSTAIVQSPATVTLGGHQNISRHIQDDEDHHRHRRGRRIVQRHRSQHAPQHPRQSIPNNTTAQCMCSARRRYNARPQLHLPPLESL